LLKAKAVNELDAERDQEDKTRNGRRQLASEWEEATASRHFF
jgi:hypothetical protein